MSRNRRQSDKSNNSKLDDSTKSNGFAVGLTEMEYFWSIELNADNRTHTWMNNDDMEDGDEDFIEHTLFLKSAALGANAVPNEHSLVTLESAGFDGDPQSGCIAHLCYGQNNMTPLDINVSGRVGPTTFTLAEGSGPVYISGNQMMGFPKDASFMDNSQTESEEDETEEEDIEVDEEKPGSEAKKPPKRKAAAIVGKPKQKAKMEKEEEEIEEDEDEEDEEEEEEEESEDNESEEEVKLKKPKKGKDSAKKETKPKVIKKPAKKSKK